MLYGVSKQGQYITASNYSAVVGTYEGGTQKMSGIVKIIFIKYSYKFETLVAFKVLPPVNGCSDPRAATPAGNVALNLQRQSCEGPPAILVGPL